MQETSQDTPWIGWAAFAIGALALCLVTVHFFAGPFAPQQAVGTTVGELAAEIRDGALRALSGEAPPPPEPLPWDIDRVLRALAGVAGAGAVILGLLSLVRREPRALGGAATVLGGGAILFQLYAMTVMIVMAMLLVMAIARLVLGDLMDSLAFWE